MPEINTIEGAIEKLYTLNVGVIGTGSERHERPHKPLLLLSVLDLLATGIAQVDNVPWSVEFRERFTTYFKVVQRANDSNTPENPFYFLRGDGFWFPVEVRDGAERELGNTPTVAMAKQRCVFARIGAGMERFFRNKTDRNKLREALVSRYFPKQVAELRALFAERDPDGPAQEEAPRSKEEADDDYGLVGRNPAFRRIVLEAYDYQCAACGLRIKLPEADLTFVDGAHLIPFSVSRNDHPTNGLALCKNHHWAMDRFLIVPTPDGLWQASTRLDARRSPGEQALVALRGQPLLPPHDDAFRPDPAGLAWRSERLLSV